MGTNLKTWTKIMNLKITIFFQLLKYDFQKKTYTRHGKNKPNQAFFKIV